MEQDWVSECANGERERVTGNRMNRECKKN